MTILINKIFSIFFFFVQPIFVVHLFVKKNNNNNNNDKNFCFKADSIKPQIIHKIVLTTLNYVLLHFIQFLLLYFIFISFFRVGGFCLLYIHFFLICCQKHEFIYYLHCLSGNYITFLLLLFN